MTLAKLKRYAITAFMALVPLMYTATSRTSATSLREHQEQYFQYLGIALFACFLDNIWLASFLVLNIVLFVANGSQVGSMQVLNVLIGCILFKLSREYFRKYDFMTFRKPIMVVSAISIVWMALQLFHLDPLFHGQTADGNVIAGAFADPIGIFGIKMANATFLNLALPIFASASIWMAPLIAIPILISVSTSCVLAMCVVSLFYTYHLHKKLFMWLLALTTLCMIGFVWYDYHWERDHRTFTSRFPMWKEATEMALKRPQGWGPDSFRNFTPHKHFLFMSDYDYNNGLYYEQKQGDGLFKYYSMTNNEEEVAELTAKVQRSGLKMGALNLWDNPHSMYVQTLFQYGILGFLLLIGLTRELIQRFKASDKTPELIVLSSCLIVYYVTGLTHFPLELARTGYLAPIFLGAFYAVTDKGEVE